MLTNIYRDSHTGGWIAEIRYRNDPRWIRIGVYGSRIAALNALGL